MNYNMDEKFKDYFQNNLKQVFLYLIDDCNLRCVQCLYKLDICFQEWDSRSYEEKEADALYIFENSSYKGFSYNPHLESVGMVAFSMD